MWQGEWITKLFFFSRNKNRFGKLKFKSKEHVLAILINKAFSSINARNEGLEPVLPQF